MQNTIRFIRRKHCDTSYEVIETAFYMYTDQNEDQSKGEKERRNEKRPKTKLPQPLRARARERERLSCIHGKLFLPMRSILLFYVFAAVNDSHKAIISNR